MGDHPKRSQSDKFKDLAREVEADENEAAFDENLRRMRTGKEQPKLRDGGQDRS